MIWTNPCAISTTRKIAILVGRNKRNITDKDLAIIGAIIRVVLIVWLFMMLQSCSAQWHLNRAIKKDPTIITDTIVNIDTTIVTNERIITDTLVITDTITHTIERDGVVVKIQRIHDTIHVDAICPPDTITINEVIPVERIIYKEKTKPLIWQRLTRMLYIVLAIVIVVFIGRLIK